VRRLIAALIILLMVGTVAGGAWAYMLVTRPYKGYVEGETYVGIAPGTSQRMIGDSLAAAGVVPNYLAFRIAVWWRGAGRRLQAGEYAFNRAMTPLEVVDKIARGDVFLLPVTFREGLNIKQMAAIFEDLQLGERRDFSAAAARPDAIRAIDPQATDLEGYLFPDTYALPRRTTAEQLVSRMVARFDKGLTPELRQQAAARGLSVRELVTLASLVEKETARAEERPLVAAVYVNRLKIGMRLQCDPTVIYALERAGRYTGNLTRADLEFDSPYNTYRYAGLPPGPIAAPGAASLEAAANPAAVAYLYFVSRNDGSHAFASTLDEHNRNVDEWQRRYFRERRGKS
jgi:UPF0755 protein